MLTRRPFGQLVGEPSEPSQEADHGVVDGGPLPGSGVLCGLPDIIGRPGRDRPVFVLARHGRNLLTVACHLSRSRTNVVASHLDQGEYVNRTPNPLDGPFMTSRQLTDYSSDPGYAIPPRDVPEGSDLVAETLARLGRKGR